VTNDKLLLHKNKVLYAKEEWKERIKQFEEEEEKVKETILSEGNDEN